MKARAIMTGVLGLAAATAVHAQMVKSTKLASNGVAISVNSDDFAGRFEYTAPTIRFKEGFALVASIKQNGVTREPFITGGVVYSDRDWRRYEQAILRGGEKVNATFGDRDVVSCAGSRYSGCTYSEGFQITLTADQRKRLAEAGSIDIQLKGTPGSEVIMTIPQAYFVAVEEVSGS